jgi:CheY-like chemotaxis protein
MAIDAAPQLKLLVVDDDREILDVFEALVGPLGYDVEVLSDSREAAQRVMKDKFDRIAGDLRMPNMNGFELTTRIRASKSNRNVPVLMFTGFDDIDTMRRGYAARITFDLAKPLNAPKLRGLFAAARGMMVQERRRYVRLPLRMNVDCRCGSKQFKVRSVNLAQGGILLESSGGMTEGDIANVEFSLPGVPQPLKLMAKVVRRAEPDAMALEFVDPEPLEQAALQYYLTAKFKY